MSNAVDNVKDIMANIDKSMDLFIDAYCEFFILKLCSSLCATLDKMSEVHVDEKECK